MPEFSNSTITLAGRQLVAQAISNSASIQFLRLELGQGLCPENPENLTTLVQKQMEIPVYFVSQSSNESCVVTGMFKVNTILTGFYAREIGIFAKINDGNEVLFAYSNSGDKADYVPAGNSSSLIECVYNLTIFVGAASVVIQDFDPNGVATKGYIDSKIAEVDIESVNEAIEKAKKDLKSIEDNLAIASKGFVQKSGDTMSGPLTVNRVIGSSDRWNGWSICSGFDELNALSPGEDVGGSSPIIDIFAKMVRQSRLICDTSEANNSLPGVGCIDFQKITNDVVLADFMALDGSLWKGCFRNGTWNGWREIATVPIGTVLPFGGSASVPAPLGYIFAHGQYLKMAEFPGLFAVYGIQYGSTDSTNFRVPDSRGNVIRGLDNGRGKDADPGRALGSEQGDSMRNITGNIGGITSRGLWGNGVFSAWDEGGDNVSGVGSGWRRQAANMDLARIGIPLSTEIRMKNIALNHIIKI